MCRLDCIHLATWRSSSWRVERKNGSQNYSKLLELSRLFTLGAPPNIPPQHTTETPSLQFLSLKLGQVQQLQGYPPVSTASDRLVIRGFGATGRHRCGRKARDNARHICDMQRGRQGPIGTHRDP